MRLMEIILVIVALYTAIWSVYVLVMPAWARLRGGDVGESQSPNTGTFPSIAVLIPAHDMEQVIGRCIASLQRSDYPDSKLVIYVIADHCSDQTVAQSVALGAVAMTRDSGLPGKTYSIAWCLEELSKIGMDPDLCVIVDATAEAHPNFLREIAGRWRTGEDVIVGHAAVDPSKQQWFVRCLGLTLVHRRLQNHSRELLGLSSLIEGRGMAYSRRYIKLFGWRLALPNENAQTHTHPTEDWRHGVRIVANGYRVAFAKDARIYTPLRGTLGAATRQGLRWERGRFGNAMTHGVVLLGQSLKERDRLKFFGALDAIQPPVAILGGLSLLVLVGSLMQFGVSTESLLFLVPSLLFAVYAVRVIALGRKDGIALWTVVWAPIYIFWRCMSFAIALFGVDRMLRRRTGSTNGRP
jgi:cellulose synthase/poly-beta-1,6-N-acetylglucosamine synthase-like glycosyltransferase